eukprot:TRINITY_DN6304_c0_g1_i1.p1 TRINITY_DN6304_c0_g1~~TRINITY_DN6304_c0_g1_i1.p1  ORF type:complete len:279 (+),score=42.24 TRINITY_DN6304_c0_g1_i1:110-838(+)
MAAQGPVGAPFEEWFRNMPVVTRTYMSACVLTTLAVFLNVVTPLDLYLNFQRVGNNLELWRLVTNFLFFDYFGVNFLFHMYFLVRHSRLLEESSFRGRTADFVFMWLLGAISLLTINFGFYYTGLGSKVMFLAPSLAFMVVYVWARRNPNVRMSFLGLFTFNAPYLPWVILGFGFMLGQTLIFDVLGIVVGHAYYYLEDVYPTISNRRLLKTPHIFKQLLDPPNQVPPAFPVQNVDQPDINM